MLVTLPVLFTASVVPKGSRNPRRQDFVRHEPFGVREATSYDAPVAARGFVSHFSGNASRKPGYSRWFEGSHWVEDTAGETGFDAAEWTERLLKPTPASSSSWESFLKKAKKGNVLELNAKGELHDIADVELREVVHSSLEEARDATRAYCDGLLLVDGVMMRRVEHPIYHVSPLGFVGVEHGVEWQDGWADYQLSTDVFTLDRYADLKMHVAEHYLDIREIPDEPEIFVPESCAWPDEETSLLLSGERCLSELKDIVADLDERQGIAWFRLKAACARAKDRIVGTKADDLAASIDELGLACGTEGTVRFERLSDVGVIAGRALSRWNLRPMAEADQALKF